MKNHWIIVGKGNGTALELFGHGRQFFRGCSVCQCVYFSRFTYVPVLAKLAGQIAARGAKGKHRRSRQKMIEWFFLNGINTKTTGTTIAGKHYLAILAGPDKTQTLLPFMQFAGARTHITLDTPVIEGVPVTGVDYMLR